MIETGSLLAVASIVGGFGINVLMFRLRRELHMRNEDERTWIPWADGLVLAAVILSLVTVLLLLAGPALPFLPAWLSSALLAASVTLLLGFPPSILSHYRLLGDRKQNRLRDNPEPSEKLWVVGTAVAALLMFVLVGWGAA